MQVKHFPCIGDKFFTSSGFSRGLSQTGINIHQEYIRMGATTLVIAPLGLG